MTQLVFLPGAGGSAEFWRPVADCLQTDRPKRFFSWPGLGNEPQDAGVRGITDLVAMVVAGLSEPADLIAQSMGGMIALRVALTAPGKVRRLILAATSAGIPMEDVGAADWRPAYKAEFPAAASWITEEQVEDLSSRLCHVSAPCLLLWGDADPISPVAVGQRLLALLPCARLHILSGAGHDLAVTHAVEVALMIAEHLR